MIPIHFGTAGWRAVIAQDFTFKNVRIVAQSIAEYLKSEKLHHKQIIVGYDTRFHSENFARATAEVLTANGIQVVPGHCPHMFWKDNAFYHRLHGFIARITGSWPR